MYLHPNITWVYMYVLFFQHLTISFLYIAPSHQRPVAQGGRGRGCQQSQRGSKPVRRGGRLPPGGGRPHTGGGRPPPSGVSDIH